MIDVFEKQKVTVEVESTPFAAKLVALRKACGMTQGDLATAAGVKRSALAMWESGGSVPRAQQIPALCRALKTTPDVLFGFDG